MTRDLNATSEVLIQVAGPLQTMGDTLRTLSVPNIQIIGIKPVVSITRPFEDVGKKFMGLALNLKSVKSTFAKITDSINQDGPKVGTDSVNTSEQAMKALIETEKTLERLKSQDLPKAIENLKATSENLRNLSTQVDSVSNVGPAPGRVSTCRSPAIADAAEIDRQSGTKPYDCLRDVPRRLAMTVMERQPLAC